MKNKDLIKKILIILGIVLTAAGVVLSGIGIFKKNSIVLYDKTANESSDKTYVFKGSLNVRKGAKDIDFEVETDSPVLIRNVEMVQYYKDEKGVRMVLANYPIESFEDNGTQYTNPEFPENVKTKIFYGDVSVADDDHLLEDDILKALTISDYEYFNEPLEKENITELSEYAGNKYDLVCSNGAYVTASDEWNVGEIKVSFITVKKDSLKDFTVAGKITPEGTVSAVSSKDGNPYVFNYDVSLDEVRNAIVGSQILNYSLIGAGLVLCIAGFVLKKERIDK